MATEVSARVKALARQCIADAVRKTPEMVTDGMTMTIDQILSFSIYLGLRDPDGHCPDLRGMSDYEVQRLTVGVLIARLRPMHNGYFSSF